jgi:hypothetical protein
MLKAIGYLLFAASAVTLYVHIRNHNLSLLHFSTSAPEPSETKTTGQIVIAPFHGNTLAERWPGEPSPSPTAKR